MDGWPERDGTGRDGLGRAGTGRARPGWTGTVWDGTGRTGRDGTGRAGPGWDGPGRDGPGRDGPGRDGPGRDGPGRDGPGGDGLIINISGSQLPTIRQAFQYFLHLQSLPENTGNPKHQDLANETVEAIIPFWQMARIKTMTKRVMECLDICSTADRLGLSDNQVTALVSATLKAGGADLDKFVISTSTTRRNRMLTRYHISQEYMAAFSEDPPNNSGVHRGAAKLLEQQLDRKVFYLACRHHILEVLVGAVWENLFGKVTAKTTLADLVGPESHLLLDTLGIEYDWLLQPVATWPRSDDYSKALEYVSSVKVVNDIAERGVKMMTDFANIITTDSQQKQYLLQTVEYNRERFDSFKKQTLKNDCEVSF
ncbi:hypothetical protein GWK47_042397 [Chionoecetes opilio]|uniref:Uncharacterized protein n=1 Tax=Chionoecetes opilio TaxID=41210 RepID=A0A8J4YBG2_CHIOP|nr:hypothetical protein GWK47_042397 [Chionoecetes opilio]